MDELRLPFVLCTDDATICPPTGFSLPLQLSVLLRPESPMPVKQVRAAVTDGDENVHD